MSVDEKLVKILFVDHTPFAGGAQLVLGDHIAEIDKNEFEVHVACTNTVPAIIERYRDGGAIVHIMPMPRLRGKNPMVIVGFMKSVGWLRKLIIKENIDLIVSNTTRASYVASIAVLGTRRPLIWWVRDYLYPKVLFSMLRRIPSKIICVSQSIKSYYMNDGDGQGEVVYVANNLYKLLEQVSPEKIEEEKRTWGIQPDDVVVGFMGRLVDEKGAEDVIDAVVALLPQYKQIKLLVVGTGEGQMNDVEEMLHRKVEHAGYKDSIRFTGYQENEPLYYSLFDIFILATRDQEPFATSVVQAMMASCAVIGTDAGGTPELVKHRNTGLLVPPHDVEAMSSAIETLIHDAELRQQVSRAGHDYVLQYHREEMVTAQLEAMYKTIVKTN